MGLLSRIFGPRRRGASDIAYQQAMGVSGDLLHRMRDHSNSNDAARAIMADVWAQRHNIPFLVSTFEVVEEMSVTPSSGRHPSSSRQ